MAVAIWIWPVESSYDRGESRGGRVLQLEAAAATVGKGREEGDFCGKGRRSWKWREECAVVWVAVIRQRQRAWATRSRGAMAVHGWSTDRGRTTTTNG
ncbi:hypothetical protein BHE74_00028861 [Ensete ventricosum]|nr:hypothetical protein BHE74_00028861 [Ensete ventricosum]RZS13982.1 hypothetical protein BHM03_00045626 [Ensete ventricosum]